MAQAKQRLSPLLDAEQRAAIAESMLRGVLASLRAVPSLQGRVLLLGSDAGVAAIAAEYELELIGEPGDIGLNAALEMARTLLHRRDVASMLVMHADLPLVDARALQELISKYVGVAGTDLETWGV
jgi:2-phospho-L-lactate guanylyltransferase (CobY/MobA/RfbA family)